MLQLQWSIWGRGPTSLPNRRQCSNSCYFDGGGASRVLVELCPKNQGLTGDRGCATILEMTPLCVPCSLAASPVRTKTNTALQLPQSRSGDKSCTTPICGLLSGLRRSSLLTRDTGPPRPCLGLQCPRAPSTLCCGLSVVAFEDGICDLGLVKSLEDGTN